MRSSSARRISGGRMFSQSSSPAGPRTRRRRYRRRGDLPGITRVTGIDFSPAMLDEFRARFPAVDLAEGDATTFRTTRTFDLIFSSHVV